MRLTGTEIDKRKELTDEGRIKVLGRGRGEGKRERGERTPWEG